MNLTTLTIGLLLIPSLLLGYGSAKADDTADKIKAAIANPDRPAQDLERDKNRKPFETLSFFQLAEDMTVLELMPGGGWYTRILGPVLAENGRLLVAIGADRAVNAVKDKPGFETTELIPFDRDNFTREDGDRRWSLPEFSFGIKKVDLVLTFRNLHNFTEKGRYNLNKAAFDALKKGGLYGVVDHTRRHMQDDNAETWRRMDPVLMIKELQAVGFEFVDYSDLHYRPDDELRYEVGRSSVTGNTDRFTLLFRKP
jgi:predicted methyltransferase